MFAAKHLFGRGWRYTVIGAFCALANYAIMLAVDAAGGHYLVGTLVAFTFVTPAAYVLHSRFTFREPVSRRSFVLFLSSAASAYPLAAGVMILLCSGLSLSVAIATPFAAIILFGWNFAAAHLTIIPVRTGAL
jgi:putative flippase GtrA